MTLQARPRPELPESRLVTLPAVRNGARGAVCSRVDLAGFRRVVLTLAPAGRGTAGDQAREVMHALAAFLTQQPEPMTVTVQTLFLREAADRAVIEAVFQAFYGDQMPITNMVIQPPCCGAALALEAWAVAREGVSIERCGPHSLAVVANGVRWVYCGGISPADQLQDTYGQTLDALARVSEALRAAGCGFHQAVRTWFYLEGITQPEAGVWRYHELNRARSDFYRGIPFHVPSTGQARESLYPASTGIGMSAAKLVVGCVALDARREDLRFLSLENPQQTPAYAYHPKFSSQSPKFSRATAVLLDDCLTTWISGTASIVSSESRHPGDIEKQTEQTIENIERLISPANFAACGVSGAGASLRDLAKVRVYLKRAEDLDRCRSICSRRFGNIPAIYAVADVCRPELLVEIEGVAFSRCRPGAARGMEV